MTNSPGLYEVKSRLETSKVQQRKKKVFSGRRVVTWSLAIIFLYIAFSFGQGFFKIQQMKGEIATLEEQMNGLREVNVALSQEVQHLHSPEAIEKLAREKLGLIQKGEIIIMRAREAQ